MRNIFVTITCLLVLLTSCVKSNVVLQSSPHIKSFRFKSHDSIPGIENITFNVDSFNCLIYNEDSVAFNHKLTKLLPVITYTGSPKEVKINNSLWNSQDSIDFSNPVSLYILSQNKKNEANYTITINQHKVNPDEIIWKDPIYLHSNASTFKVTSSTKALYVFACNPQATSTQYTVYSNNGTGWSQIATFESNYQIVSIASHLDQIYAIDTNGTTLLRLTNNQWEETINFSEGKMTSILGTLNNTLWIAGTSNTENNQLLSYNGQHIQQNTQSTLPDLFALEGSTTLQTPYGLYLIGGKKNGIAQNCILSTDNGYYWTNVLNQTGQYSIDACYNAIAAYYNHCIYVIGGLNNEQVVTKSYASNNNGFSWNETSSYQQLPSSFSFQNGACAAVLNDNLYVFNRQNNQIEVWEGRIRKVDFLRK